MHESDVGLAEGASDLHDFVPGMLKKSIIEFIFIPWLCKYTERVRMVAKKEERDAILALPNLPDELRHEIEARGQSTAYLDRVI